TVFWLATAATITLAETLVAAAVALVGAVLARVARRAMPFNARPRRVWLGWAALVPVAAAADMARLVRWYRGPQKAEVRESRMPASERPPATGWRAGGITVLSATPGSVVIDSDPTSGRVKVHSLVGGWPHLDEKVLRAREPGK
ncbi:MAG: hypothetical protein HOQ07_09635, partial [Sinomonas sp.]|nr:hypothetical protein [Sinomonas sp.]